MDVICTGRTHGKKHSSLNIKELLARILNQSKSNATEWIGKINIFCLFLIVKINMIAFLIWTEILLPFFFYVGI